MQTVQAQTRQSYDELIGAACSQPGVFEVMEVMRRAHQHMQTLEVLHIPPSLRVIASSSSLPLSVIYPAQHA